MRGGDGVRLWKASAAGVAIVAAGLLLGGCWSIQAYPEGWAPVAPAPDDGCYSIAGDYAVAGGSGDGRAWSLGEVLIPFKRNGWGERVRLAQPDADTLEVLRWEAGGPVLVRTFSCRSGDLDCTREGIVLSVGHRSPGTPDHPGAWWAHATLARATDGALIVQLSGLRLVGSEVLPIFGFGWLSKWTRFPAAEMPAGP